MEVFAVRTRLKAGMEEAYEQAHRVVPAEVADDLARRSFTDWRIFRHGQDLFHIITATGRDAFAADEHSQEIGKRWREGVGPYLEPVHDDVGSADMHLVWSLSENGDHA